MIAPGVLGPATIGRRSPALTPGGVYAYPAPRPPRSGLVTIPSCEQLLPATVTPTGPIAYGTQGRSLYVYAPPAPEGAPRGPAMILFHGTGFTANASPSITLPAYQLVSRGITVVSADYDATTYLTCRTAAVEAFAYTVALPTVDPLRVGVGGYSVGGYPAAWLAYLGSAAYAVLWYPAIGGFADVAANYGAGYQVQFTTFHAGALGAADIAPSPGQCPVLISHGSADVSVYPAVSAAYETACGPAGVECLRLIATARTHGYNMIRSGTWPANDAVLPATSTFLGFPPGDVAARL